MFTATERITEPEKLDTESPMISPVKDRNEVNLNDKLIRMIGIPFFGIVIPNVSGLFGTLTWESGMYWTGYAYFIGLAAAIWQGNRYLLFRTRKRFTWFDKPIEKLILLIVNNIFYTSPLTIAWLCSWYNFSGLGKVNWTAIQVVVLINVICVLFVTHVYETVFMVKEQQSEQLKSAELERAKAQAELAALKNQVDPHFMFNSLNSLSYLISKDPQRAAEFTENLAEVYRYILSQKDHALVLLEDELEFTHKYTDLLHLRFGNVLQFKRRFDSTLEKKYLIPPTSVFVAFENVVKHNEIGEQFPLQIDVELIDNALIITNHIREKRNVQHSSMIGLRNLDERFKLITGKNITSSRTEQNTFRVEFPLIALNT